jgi:hypothetical protein
MFSVLKPFDLREPVTEDYQVPTVDVLSDSAGGVLVVVPAAPSIVSCIPIGLEWETVGDATGYYVEQMTQRNTWTRIATVAQPASLQIVWNFAEWDINLLVGAVWQTQYNSTDVVTTPDQVTTWRAVGGIAPFPTVQAGGPVGVGGMEITGAGTGVVNSDYLLSGMLNGSPSYASPEIARLSFSPVALTLYRVRAFNSAGISDASNPMVLNES